MGLFVFAQRCPECKGLPTFGAGIRCFTCMHEHVFMQNTHLREFFLALIWLISCVYVHMFTECAAICKGLSTLFTGLRLFFFLQVCRHKCFCRLVRFTNILPHSWQLTFGLCILRMSKSGFGIPTDTLVRPLSPGLMETPTVWALQVSLADMNWHVAPTLTVITQVLQVIKAACTN